MKRTFALLAFSFALFAANAAFAADTVPAFITQNLGPGDEGAEVTLLQTWLSERPDLYPEAAVNGTYGPATKKAVERYQKEKGMVLSVGSGGSATGFVGPMTRANLNADFSANKGGIAAVETKYGDAYVYKEGKFVQLSEVEYGTNVPVIQRFNVWIHPAALSERRTPVIANGKGYAVGLADNGKIYVQTPSSYAETASVYAVAGEWHHIAVLFTPKDTAFIFDNKVVETVAYKNGISNFFESLFSRVADSFKTLTISTGNIFNTKVTVAPVPAAKPAPAAEVAEPSPIVSFFENLLGISLSPAPQVAIDMTPASGTVSSGGSSSAPASSAEPEKPVEEKPAVVEKPAVTPPKVDVKPPVLSTLFPATTTVVTPISTSTATTTIVTATTTASTASSTASTATSTATTTADSGSSSGGGGASASAGINRKPVITLTGSADISLPIGTIYTDPGVTVTDSEDGDLTGSVIVGGDTVRYDTPGTYTITYNVKDKLGLNATQVTRVVTITPPPSIPTSAQEPSYALAPAGQEVVYSVSNGATADPQFTSVDIKPLHVYVGDTQTMTVNVSSASGVKSVTAVTQLDTVTHTLNLEKTGGTAGGVETFSASWVVYDTHTATYRTTFTATANSGATNSTKMAWSDPCSGVTQGTNSSLSTDCAVSTVSGLDGGTLTIPAGVTLTINNGGTWVFNPGTSIKVDGALVKGSGGQIKKGYIFYQDCSGCVDTNTAVFNTSSTVSGYTRVSTYSQGTYYSQGYYYAQGYYQGYYYAQGYYYSQGYYYAQSFYEMMYVCFGPDTKIEMANGTTKAIKDVKVGDMVVAEDLFGNRKINIVTKVFVHGPEENGGKLYDMLNINDSVTTRPEHLFHTERGWVPAGRLIVGDVITGLAGGVEVTSIKPAEGLPVVYNLSTFPNHTFFANGFLVHNIKQQCDFC
jgi:hypothetical protein